MASYKPEMQKQKKTERVKSIKTKHTVALNTSNGLKRPTSASASIPSSKLKPTLKRKSHPAPLSVARSQTAEPNQQATGSSVPVRPKLLRRFYEALALLTVFGPNRGDYQDEEELEPLEEPSSLNNEKLRRSFVKSLAYLCEYEKGGAQTTAIALQQTPQGVVYWFASNQVIGRKDTVHDFLHTTLRGLSSITTDHVAQAETDLFARAVAFSAKKIKTYIRFLRPSIKFVLDYMKEQENEGM